MGNVSIDIILSFKFHIYYIWKVEKAHKTNLYMKRIQEAHNLNFINF